MARNECIEAVNRCGQSIWYDNLSRDLLGSGALAGYIDAGVSGLTSNPTIFKKAIADSAHYDGAIAASNAADAEALCEDLMVEDVGAAADLLRPVYERSDTADGYASIEVSPLLANDTATTVAAARHLWARLSRPNIMIKVPATDAGLPAVATLLSEGINVNVTLIFSVQRYEEVAQAYLRGLEARRAKGGELHGVRSVASFFVSRVDSIFEETIRARSEEDWDGLVGQMGIANSKAAYGSFQRIFAAPRFRALAASGALVQRPLWASTGVKNPAYHPLHYVQTLVGHDTVNTVPPQTLDVLLRGAAISPRLEERIHENIRMLESLGGRGIDLQALLTRLQLDGVKLFADSYRELIEAVSHKKESLKGS